MSRRLGDYFERTELARDGSFDDLGNADGEAPGTLAYCDTAFHADLAAANPNVSCVITTPALAQRFAGKGLATAASPRAAFYRLHERLAQEAGAGPAGIHTSAIVSPNARIGREVTIRERAVVMDGVELGDGCFVDAGAILGAEGLLHYEDAGTKRRVPHRGGVRIGRQACILANAVVVRGIHPGMPTLIEDHAMIGVASTIGHECRVGANAVVSGNCVIARGADIGRGAWIGTSSVVREYVRVGERARVMAGSVVIEDVARGAEVSGNFAVLHRPRLLQFRKDRR